MNDICDSLIFLDLNKDDKSKYIIKIQKIFRGYNLRKKSLPIFLQICRNYLNKYDIILDNSNKDGRIDSCSDEDIIIDILCKKFQSKIQVPKIRMWYDILIYDSIYKWIPINIKTTKIKTSDNAGNLTMCVYSYTDEVLDLNIDKSYTNGKMSKILIEKIKNKKYNRNYKKDYFFLVINKNDTKDVIINSIKGLSELTPNNNNLPFQICWDKNRKFIYKNIKENIDLFIKTIQRPKPSWEENFLEEIRKF